MKFFIATLILVSATIAAPSCTSANYCMACDSATANKCSACFNWMAGTLGPRYLNTTTYDCKSKFSTGLVTDCKMYGELSSDALAAMSCMMCDSKDYLNVAASGTIAVSCSDTAQDTTNCTSTISNCQQTICAKAASTDTSAAPICFLCDSGYKGSGTFNTIGYPSCASASNITNCDDYLSMTSSNDLCYTCDSDYAVASTQQSCVGYTADSNCRRLQSDGTNCHYCWHSYYWDTATCKLGSNMIVLGSLAMSILAFFW